MACSELALAGRYNRVQAETEVRWPLTKKKRKTTRWAKAFGLGAGVCIRKIKPGENDAGIAYAAHAYTHHYEQNILRSVDSFIIPVRGRNGK